MGGFPPENSFRQGSTRPGHTQVSCLPGCCRHMSEGGCLGVGISWVQGTTGALAQHARQRMHVSLLIWLQFLMFLCRFFDYGMFFLIMLNCVAMAYEYPSMDKEALDGQILFWR